MVSFSVTFSNVLLSLLFLLPGFLLCRWGKVKPDHLSSISVILLYVCGPCMFLDALTGLEPSAELNTQMGLFFLFSLAAQILLMLLLLLVMGKQRRGEFRFRMLSIASVMGNVGFFGLPIVRALYPDAPEAAVYSCVFCATLNILSWTVGVFTLTGEKKYISLRQAFLNPTVLSIAIGIILYLFRARNWLPELLRTGVRTISGMSTALCMMILGIRLGAMKAKPLFTTPLVYLVALGKLVIFPLFSYLLVLPFPLPPVFKASMLVLAATPCASILLNLAEMHHNGQEFAANCCLLTTLLSILTIPLLSLLI